MKKMTISTSRWQMWFNYISFWGEFVKTRGRKLDILVARSNYKFNMEKDCNAKIQMPDLSGIEFIGEIKEVPAWEMGVKITIGVSIELVAIVGNLLIIIIIAQSPKMRNVTNYYILNLAISDLLVGLFAIWIHLVDDLTQGWVLGSFLCKFNPFMQSKC